jgi:IS30 family transposase
MPQPAQHPAKTFRLALPHALFWVSLPLGRAAFRKDIDMAKNYKRLTLGERRAIERALEKNTSLKQIARDLGRDAGTVSREIHRNSTQKKTGGGGAPFNECANRRLCRKQALCGKEGCRREYCGGCTLCAHVCGSFEPEYCSRLESPPYVCNGCAVRRKCTLAKFVYKAHEAQRIYEATLSQSRSGVALTEAERARIDGIVTPLIRQGQSPYHICLNNKGRLMISDKTLYKYIAANFFGASSTDLARKVKMRPRRKKREVKVERSCRQGRSMQDLMAYLEASPDTEIVQADTVIGAKGSGQKVLLTIHFTHSHFMLAFLRDANTAQSVCDVFGWLYGQLGEKGFAELFPVLTPDNGPEFSAPTGIEKGEGGKLRTRVFYCDPYQSNQKAACENNHRLIRMVLPKGVSMNGLTQGDIGLMMSHINSYARKSLGGQTPAEVFSRQHRNIKCLLEKLGIRPINTNDINLTPKLLKR